MDQPMVLRLAERNQDNEPGLVSLMAEVPEPLLQAMRHFIERHPNWDQYRLIQAALAGFLVQHAPGDRSITRCYLANLFPGSGRFQEPPIPQDHAGDGERLRPLARHHGSGARDRRNAADPGSLAA
jgi:hypothetical protein